ncbi:hypothetical protein D3C75_527570 [compost metagenome]
MARQIAGAIAQQLAQNRNHVSGFYIIVDFRSHADRLQCVVNEMRIDLALQRMQLRFLLLLLYPVNILDQLADARKHTVELMTEQAYFIPAFHAEVDIQITVLHLFHQLNHLCQRFGQGKGQNNGDN